VGVDEGENEDTRREQHKWLMGSWKMHRRGKERIEIFGVGRREGILWLWDFVAMWKEIRLRGARGGMNEKKR